MKRTALLPKSKPLSTIAALGLSCWLAGCGAGAPDIEETTGEEQPWVAATLRPAWQVAPALSDRLGLPHEPGRPPPPPPPPPDPKEAGERGLLPHR
jgi:hypothetical protein